MRPEELTIFGLSAPNTEQVRIILIRRKQWDLTCMIVDEDATLLMTIGETAKARVMEVLRELGLLPERTLTIGPARFRRLSLFERLILHFKREIER